jgi:hypothetical protein
MRITHVKLAPPESRQSKRLLTICAELAGPHEYMTTTVKVPGGTDNDVRERGIARAQELARNFAALPRSVFSPSKSPAAVWLSLKLPPNRSTIEQRLFHVRRRIGANGFSEWYVLNGHTRRPLKGTYRTWAAAEARRRMSQAKHDLKFAAAMKKLARWSEPHKTGSFSRGFGYQIQNVTGDRYAGEWPREQFRKRGIAYSPSEMPKSALYLDLLTKLNSRTASLERRTARGGKDSIDHPPSGKDDVCRRGGACPAPAHNKLTAVAHMTITARRVFHHRNRTPSISQ